MPKKGRLSEADKARESDPEFVRLRRQHSAVESAINALGVHGLDKCPDHGIDGFKRYVALAIVARNIQRLGAVLTHLRDSSLPKLLIFRCRWFLFRKNPLKSMVIFRFLL